jgi:hypothetical protein
MSPASPFDDARRMRSEELAFQAEQVWAGGRHDEARRLFAEAAALEQAVAQAVDPSPELNGVRGLLAISAVALWYKATEYSRAKVLAYGFLARPEHLTGEATKELEQLVDSSSREAEVTRVTRDPGMIPVEVKLDGGRVGVGIAPESAVRKRRESVASMLMRVGELETKQPYRERGASGLEREDEIQVYEAPAYAASYGLRFYVATGTQQVVPTVRRITPDKVVERFLDIAAAAEQGPAAVRELVDDDQYARAFIEGFADIAPDGEDVQSVSCAAPTWKISPRARLDFKVGHRDALRAATEPRELVTKPGEKEFIGTLLAIHLKGDTQWADLEVMDGAEPQFLLLQNRRQATQLVSLLTTRVRMIAKYSAKSHRYEVRDFGGATKIGVSKTRAGPRRGRNKAGA